MCLGEFAFKFHRFFAGEESFTALLPGANKFTT